MKLTIDRSKWLHGEGTENSMLLRPSDSKMCCLGFLSKECGLEDDVIKSAFTPANLNKYHYYINDELPEWVFDDFRTKDNSLTVENLMAVNDNKELDDLSRERQIKEVFATVGVEVEFVGKY